MLAVAASASVEGAARASPEFPNVVKQTLNLRQAPDCTLCHGLGQTGFRTVTTTFGSAMLAGGAIAGNDETIRAALISLQANNSPLIADLVEGRDPNRAAGDPRYGCGSNAAPGALSPGLLLPMAFVLWFGWRRLGRRR
jgi:hypothetical protein